MTTTTKATHTTALNNMSLKQEIVVKARLRRKWETLPYCFEYDAVKACVKSLEDLCNRDERKQLLKARKSTTFAELLEIFQC